jgi:hypothetical protein
MHNKETGVFIHQAPKKETLTAFPFFMGVL